MARQSTPLFAKVLYWFLRAPVAFLCVMYAGILPLAILGLPDQRAPFMELAVAPYAAVVVVTAVNFTWGCWRAIRGDSPATALRPFPGPVWLASLAVGLACGTFALVVAAA